ncbi:hypothetical protein NKH24_06955 [Mesorhizobium sp. M1300]
MTIRIKVPGGTLKVKTYRELRTRERERRLPMLRLGSLYLIWLSNKLRQ